MHINLEFLFVEIVTDPVNKIKRSINEKEKTEKKMEGEYIAYKYVITI